MSNNLKIGIPLLFLGYGLTGFLIGFMGSERLGGVVMTLLFVPAIAWVVERLQEHPDELYFELFFVGIMNLMWNIGLSIRWAIVTGYWSVTVAWILTWICAALSVGGWFFVVNDANAWNKGWTELWVWFLVALGGALLGGGSVGGSTKIGSIGGIGIALLAYIQASCTLFGYILLNDFFKRKRERRSQFIGFATLIAVSSLSLLFGAGFSLNFINISNI